MLKNVTMEGLMDIIVKTENTNVTFELEYASSLD